MRPDLSALDAQLDALSPAPSVDVLALAEGYAGKLGPLPSIDDVLSGLEVGLPPVTAAKPAAEVYELIELPETLPEQESEPTEVSARALEFEADVGAPIPARQDVEPLAGSNDFRTRETGTVNVTSPYVARHVEQRDITIEPIDEELLEAGIEDMRPEAAPLANNALFDLRTPANVEAEQEADAAFAALFAEATRQSSMPSISESEPGDDTEVFRTSELALDPEDLQTNMPRIANADDEIELEPGFHDETLDSAEFEIVNDVVTDGSPNGRPSRPPEKRPSFLGRLFGRKDE